MYRIATQPRKIKKSFVFRRDTFPQECKKFILKRVVGYTKTDFSEINRQLEERSNSPYLLVFTLVFSAMAYGLHLALRNVEISMKW